MTSIDDFAWSKWAVKVNSLNLKVKIVLATQFANDISSALIEPTSVGIRDYFVSYFLFTSLSLNTTEKTMKHRAQKSPEWMTECHGTFKQQIMM